MGRGKRKENRVSNLGASYGATPETGDEVEIIRPIASPPVGDQYISGKSEISSQVEVSNAPEPTESAVWLRTNLEKYKLTPAELVDRLDFGTVTLCNMIMKGEIPAINPFRERAQRFFNKLDRI